MYVQAIANTGKLVIVSVQHPSARELPNFNSILLLKSGGETVYFKNYDPHEIVAESIIVNSLPLSYSKIAIIQLNRSICSLFKRLYLT